ncbi:MAG: aminotransferase class I/II-fold pyridoxal phosphate-dependent enzyme [Planctomycetaceae bacterium]|jgi:aspartate aminotransferase/aminotransferase|nr:aminotransferase class I/II-fold pyridoxal phosphate-dependent enzyme [Planctomycetaceae bacterium]
MSSRWISKRAGTFEASGIRRVFDLAAKLKNPVNLSIGQPDFDVPAEAKKAMIDAVNGAKSGYTPTQGLAALRETMQKRTDAKYHHSDRSIFIASGTSGALALALLVAVDAGDEVIFFDPYFVMYDALVRMTGGTPVPVSTYPHFQYDIGRLADAITPKTKAIILNSPANPSGKVATREEVKAVAELAAKHDILLISDEIYSTFCYQEFASPAEYNPQTLVLDGFSKSHGMPGWRVGYAHGPKELIEQMLKFQQYTFVCSPHVGQLGALAVLDADMSAQIESYKKRRDMIYEALKDDYEINKPEGAFYMFPKAPWGTGTEFVEKAITEYSMLIIPGGVFSTQDTHFRISYSAAEPVIERGIEAFKKLAKQK